MLVWVDWTKYESGYYYGAPEALSMIGWDGSSYGMYQFDYQYGLVPFMQFCQDHNQLLYEGFTPYINMGVGSQQLVGNTSLHNWFIRYANEYTEDFLYCQDGAYVDQYLTPAITIASNHNLANLNNPYMLGTLGSMAIRSGAFEQSLFGEAVRAMAQYTNLEDQLRAGYTVYENYYAPRGDDRWYRQLADCLSDMANGEWVVDIYGEAPTPPIPIYWGRKRLLFNPWYITRRRRII